MFTSLLVLYLQFNLICARKSLLAHATSVFFVGSLIGSFIGGPLADRYVDNNGVLIAPIQRPLCRFGRKPVALIASFVGGWLGILHGLTTNYYMLLLLRLLVAVFILMAWMAWYTLGECN